MYFDSCGEEERRGEERRGGLSIRQTISQCSHALANNREDTNQTMPQAILLKMVKLTLALSSSFPVRIKIKYTYDEAPKFVEFYLRMQLVNIPSYASYFSPIYLLKAHPADYQKASIRGATI